MPSIVRHLAAFGALAIGACGEGGLRRPREVEDEALLAAAFDKTRVDRAQQVLPQLPMVIDGPLLFPYDKPSPDGLLNNVSFNGVTCDAGGRSFYFLSTWLPPKPEHTLHWVEPGSGRRSEPVVATIQRTFMDTRLPFGVQPIPGGLLVVYPDGTRVREVRARVVEAGLAFDEPRTIATAAHEILVLQLTPTDDRLHLIWTTLDRLSDTSLHYTSAARSDLEWSPPRELADTVGYGTGCLAAGDRDVYFAWGDFRYRERHWDSYTNAGKVVVTGSRDGGRTFLPPVMISDPGEANDCGLTLDLLVGRGGIAVYWMLPDKVDSHWIRWWGRAALDFDLERVVRGPRVGCPWNTRCR